MSAVPQYKITKRAAKPRKAKTTALKTSHPTFKQEKYGHDGVLDDLSHLYGPVEMYHPNLYSPLLSIDKGPNGIPIPRIFTKTQQYLPIKASKDSAAPDPRNVTLSLPLRITGRIPRRPLNPHPHLADLKQMVENCKTIKPEEIGELLNPYRHQATNEEVVLTIRHIWSTLDPLLTKLFLNTGKLIKVLELLGYSTQDMEKAHSDAIIPLPACTRFTWPIPKDKDREARRELFMWLNESIKKLVWQKKIWDRTDFVRVKMVAEVERRENLRTMTLKVYEAMRILETEMEF